MRLFCEPLLKLRLRYAIESRTSFVNRSFGSKYKGRPGSSSFPQICIAVMATAGGGVDPERISVRALSADSVNGISEDAKRYAMPRLADLLNYIRELESGQDEPYGRRYQLETIQRGELRLPSPFSGEFVRSTSSYLVRGRLFYHFPDATNFFVVASRVNRGFPLSGIFVPAANLMLSWQHSRGDDRALRSLEGLARQLLHDPCDTGPAGGARVVIVMGNSNFAHHLWNELAAVEHLLSKGTPVPTPEFMIVREPLGRIDRIFPEVADWKIHRAPFAGMEGSLYTKLGSYRISDRVRNRLLRHARNEVSAEIALLMQRIRRLEGPVFWLSIRTTRPTLKNQRETILAVCRRLLEANARCCILIDGFSLPEDWSNPQHKKAESYDNLAQASRKEIDAIIGEISHLVRDSQLVANVGGIRLLDSIALAELADGYFCHSGSIQHKIAWTANKPGIIHGSRKTLMGKPEIWHSERLEGGVPPVPLPISMVRDVKEDDRERNYRADSRSVAEFVANYFSYLLRHE